MIRKIMFIIALCTFVAAPAMADFYVDLGSSEAGVTLSGWGPVEPTTTGGNWGGFGSTTDNYVAPTTATADYLARTVWGYAENTTDASILFPTTIYSATIRHLDGGSTDSFKVEVDGVLWGTYTGNPGLTGGKTYSEQWFETSFTGTPGTLLTITATASAGTYWNPYGQVGIDRVEAVVPVPGAVLLGILGLSAVGIKLRKFA